MCKCQENEAKHESHWLKGAIVALVVIAAIYGSYKYKLLGKAQSLLDKGVKSINA